jgi:glycosyltransferase involved in cell wall biosynthesis
MKISGFTIARGAVTFGYQLEESIRSLLPLVDEFVVGVGDLDDGTWELVEGIGDSKIKAFRTTWDMSLRKGGQVLAVETNKALERCTGDWAVYLQADEVLHEDDLPILRDALSRHLDTDVEGLDFDYLHFYGSFRTVQDNGRKWYRRAPRAVKTGLEIRSWGDACTFRRLVDGEERRCKLVPCGARVFHYGWSRPPEIMVEKQKNLDRMYHDEAWVAERYAGENAKVREFYRERGHLRFFEGSHPATMAARVAAQDWSFEDGIDRQWPDWLRHFYLAYLHPAVSICQRTKLPKV